MEDLDVTVHISAKNPRIHRVPVEKLVGRKRRHCLSSSHGFGVPDVPAGPTGLPMGGYLHLEGPDFYSHRSYGQPPRVRGICKIGAGI
jgi:hypothetical protein